MTVEEGEGDVIRVLLVDDQILMREGLRKLLEIEPDIEIVGSAANGADALRLLSDRPATDHPHVALVDARMPVMDGVELDGRLRAEFPAIASVMLTTFDDDYIFGGLRAGAKGYLLKDTPPDELVAAIQRAARGETVLSGAATERLVAALRESAHVPRPEPEPARHDQEPHLQLPAEAGGCATVPSCLRGRELLRPAGAAGGGRGAARRGRLRPD
ncbi:MAG: response regulator transcription factor, partial [Nonomuraea sp.]|nr:response regulator transcription factor [Nonomuraea sp.]